jgi:two-component system, chemotaxis family, response regulator WspF
MRIAIVNDVALAAEVLRRIVIDSREHQVAWTAQDGAQAVELCARDTPDLILMDLVMPRVDGVEATRRIMARTPCAILIVTANVTDSTSRVFEAMGAGALDAVNTPVFQFPGSYEGASVLLAKIETIRKLIGAGSRQGSASSRRQAAPPLPAHEGLVAIGASAGGPAALAKILARLPEDLPAPVIIVQHVDSQFAPGLAHWLDDQTPLEVCLARDGDRPQPGRVLLAGRESHLILTSSTRLGYTEQPTESSYRPSIDVLFGSLDRFWRGDVVAVLLTGMGRDGVEGLRTLHSHGHHTIAQDQTTSAVYGMPKAAAEVHAATEILALDKIGPRISNLLAQRMKAHG